MHKTAPQFTLLSASTASKTIKNENYTKFWVGIGVVAISLIDNASIAHMVVMLVHLAFACKKVPAIFSLRTRSEKNYSYGLCCVHIVW